MFNNEIFFFNKCVPFEQITRCIRCYCNYAVLFIFNECISGCTKNLAVYMRFLWYLKTKNGTHKEQFDALIIS